MRLIGERAEVRIDVGNQIFDHSLLKGAEVERASSGTRTGRSRIGRARSADATVLHHDDERLAFSLGDQVVHDEAGVALMRPARFILAATMLEIKHRITPARV